MATQHTTGGAIRPLPNPALLESAIRRLSRASLEDLCEQLIDRLDAMDPDPDIEANGDELDANGAEDDFMPHSASWKGEPGCPVSDPDCSVDDEGEAIDEREPEDFADEPETSDPTARVEHRRRIQQTRCIPRQRRYRDFRSGAIVTETFAHQLYYEPTVPTKRSLLNRKRGVPRRPRG